jgi:hypothetical protein
MSCRSVAAWQRAFSHRGFALTAVLSAEQAVSDAPLGLQAALIVRPPGQLAPEALDDLAQSRATRTGGCPPNALLKIAEARNAAAALGQGPERPIFNRSQRDLTPPRPEREAGAGGDGQRLRRLE